MGLEIWDFTIPAFLLTGSTVVLGGIFVLAGWIKIAGDSKSATHRAVPIGLCMYTASVFSDLVGFGLFGALNNDERLSQRVWFIFLIISLMLVLASMIVVHLEPSSAQGVVKTGSIVLLVVNVLGFTLFFLTLPGMPLH